MANINAIRIDYDNIDNMIGEKFPLKPGKNYLTYMVHMEGISPDGEIRWEMINKEIPATNFELTNFEDQDDFKAYVKCYFEDWESPIRPISKNTAIVCWGIFFIQEMDPAVYFGFVNDLIEFNDFMGVNGMSCENFAKFIKSRYTNHNDSTFCVIGPTRPVIWSINTKS